MGQLDRTHAPEVSSMRVNMAGHTFRQSRDELPAILRSRSALGLTMPPVVPINNSHNRTQPSHKVLNRSMAVVCRARTARSGSARSTGR